MMAPGVGRKWGQGMLRSVCVGAVVALATAAGAAQAPVFQSAPTYPFLGSFQDALPVLAVADVGSPSNSPSAGAPDHIPDLITANQAQKVLVLFGDGKGGFSSKGASTSLPTIPTALAAADFDNNTFIDLLVADTSDVRFLQGKSTGLPFTAPGPPIAAGLSPQAIGVGRLNSDQNLDAAVVDGDPKTCLPGGVTVLLGDGNGGFTSGTCKMGGGVCGTDADCGTNGPCNPKTVPTGVGSSAIALWDANNDGIIDYLAVTNACDNTVTILKGDGTGAFTVLGMPYLVGSSPVAIAAADLHRTGQMDLITVNSNSDNIAILDGVGDGTFKPARFFASGGNLSAPNGLALADFSVSGTGPLDVVVSNNFTFDVSVLRNDGQANFGTPRAFVADHQPLAVATGQFDPDSIPDVVTVNVGSTSETAAVLLGRMDGTLAAIENVIPPHPTTAVTAGDADNDGLSDLIATADQEVLIYPSKPGGGFAMPETLQSAGDTFAVGHGDFNGDGLLDVVAVNQSTMNVSIFLGQAQGGFAAKSDYDTGPGVSGLSVGDWNGDGLSDLAVTFQGTSLCNVTTTRTCSMNADCPAGHCSVTTTKSCHLNSDCKGGETCSGGEICVGAVGVLLAAPDKSGRLGPMTMYAVGSRPVAIDFGDFNNDGIRDLVVANTDSSDLSILIGNGNGTFKNATEVPGLSEPLALAVADFNRDGSDDVAVAGSRNSSVGLLYGNGSGGFSAGTPLSLSGQNASSLAARDVTGDSIPDVIVTTAGETNSAFVFVNNGANFQQPQVMAMSRGPGSLITADFFDDGRYDAAGSCGQVSCLPVLTNILATPVLRGDANGDGVVSAADAVGVMRELGDGNGTRIEDVKRGAYAAAPGVDANGDGWVTLQDTLAVAHRLFAAS